MKTTPPRAAAAGGVVNAFSVDVEDYFQVSAFADVVSRGSWDSMESRVERNTGRVLDLLQAAGFKATFFVLGWIAERHGPLVRRIAELGHEIGSHGYSHELVYRQTPEVFRREVRRSKDLLEQAGGRPVVGYRAASFSITRASLWALDVLAEEGFEYDSSVFPVVHDRYGVPGAPRRIHRLRTAAGRSLVEVPPSTIRLGGLVLPVGGGGYLRIYPPAFTRWAIGRLNRSEGLPAVVYMHPWELDPDQPRIQASWKSRFRHYRGLARTEDTLRGLFSSFAFGTMSDVIAAATRVPERKLA